MQSIINHAALPLSLFLAAAPPLIGLSRYFTLVYLSAINIRVNVKSFVKPLKNCFNFSAKSSPAKMGIQKKVNSIVNPGGALLTVISMVKAAWTNGTSSQKKKDTEPEPHSSSHNSIESMGSLRRARSYWIFVQRQDLGVKSLQKPCQPAA